MCSGFRHSQRILPLMGLVLVLALASTACGLLESRLRGASLNPTPTAGPTGSTTPVPEARLVGPLGVEAKLINGRPYLVEAIPGATFNYEVWVDYRAVERVKEAYSVAKEVLRQELGVEEIPPVEVYLAPEEESARLAESQGFPHASWLMGLSTYNLRDGKVVDAKVVLNAEAEGLLHNAGHELTHLAVPGLPSWLSEGVAEYIGTRVERAMDPQRQLVRMLMFRRVVREAVTQGKLPDRRQFESFDWAGEHTYDLIDLTYAQAWNLVEYIAGSDAPDALRKLVSKYRQGVQEGEDPLQQVLGARADLVWEGFTNDIVENLTVEELIGNGLCGLVRLASEGAAINREWNQLLPQIDMLDPGIRTRQLQRFQQRWQGLAGNTAELPVLGAVVPFRDLTLSYFQTMAQVMEQYANFEVTAANQSLLDANQRYSQLGRVLQEAFRQQAWLRC